MLRAVCSPLVLALGGLALLLIALEAWRPGYFLHDDNAMWFAGAYAQDFRTLTETGRIAEVNFYQYGGEPFVGQGQTAVLYPPVYVAAALASVVPGDLRATVDWLAAIHLALGVVGFYAWVRRGGAAHGSNGYGVDTWAAALGGLIWALNPFVLLLGASWITVTAVVAWLPWLFFGVDLVVDRSGTPPGCGRFFDLFRGCRASSEQGTLNPRLPGWQASGLQGASERETATGSRESVSPAQGLHRLPSAMTLGVIAGLFVLQGYVQWTVYAFLFAGMYGVYLIFVARTDGKVRTPSSPAPGGRGLPLEASPAGGNEPLPSPLPGVRRLPLAALALAGVVATAIALPQVLPMIEAAGGSKARAQVLPLMWELYYRVEPGDLLAAQVGVFREHFLFDASTALFFCPALVLLPLAVVRFARGDAGVRRRLFPLVVLAVLALFFSGSGYLLLNIVPLMQKFRWPFKVFVFAEFFLIAALVWSCGFVSRNGATIAKDGATKLHGQLRSQMKFGNEGIGRFLLALVLVLQVGVAVGEHDANFLSQAVLPMAKADLPKEVDPALGRVIAIVDPVPVAEAWRYLMFAYGTFYRVPSLGGYNPLVSRASLDFSLGLDVPNRFEQVPTPEMRAVLERRAVRYWIVDAQSPQRAEVEKLEGMKLLGVGSDPYSRAPSGASAKIPVLAPLQGAGTFLGFSGGVAHFVGSTTGYGLASLRLALSGTPEVREGAMGSHVSPLGGSATNAAPVGGMSRDAGSSAAGTAAATSGSPTSNGSAGLAPLQGAGANANRNPVVSLSRQGGIAQPPANGLSSLRDDTKSAPVVFEDTHAQAMVDNVGPPGGVHAIYSVSSYKGNSMFVPLWGEDGVLAVSVGPTEGWWYRLDGGAWKKGDYRDDRLYIPVTRKDRELEVTYFDSQLRHGFRISFFIIILLTVALLVKYGIASRALRAK